MARTEKKLGTSYIPNSPYSHTRTRATSVRPFNRPSAQKCHPASVYSSVHLTRERADTRDKVRAKSAQLHVPGKCVSALQRAAARSRPFKRMRADVLRDFASHTHPSWTTRDARGLWRRCTRVSHLHTRYSRSRRSP